MSEAAVEPLDAEVVVVGSGGLADRLREAGLRVEHAPDPAAAATDPDAAVVEVTGESETDADAPARVRRVEAALDAPVVAVGPAGRAPALLEAGAARTFPRAAATTHPGRLAGLVRDCAVGPAAAGTDADGDAGTDADEPGIGRRLRLVAERVDEVIYVADAGFEEVAYVNESYESVWGRPVETVYDDARSFVEGIHPDDRPAFRERFESMLADVAAGRAADDYAFDFRVERPDGETRWVHATTYPVTLADGRRRLVGVADDVTDRKERERRLGLIAERVDAVLYFTTIDLSETLYVNDAYEELWGRPVEELYDDPLSFLDGVHEADRDGLVADVERARAEIERGEADDVYELDYRVVRPDGTVRHVTTAAHPVRVTGGPDRLVCVTEDVTERVARERRLAEERGRYAALVEQSHDGVGVVTDGEWTFVNDRLVELTGYDGSELVGTDFAAVFEPEDRELVRERYERRIAADGESPPNRYDVSLRTADGDVRTLELAVSRIRHEGEPATLANFRDVTDRRRRERAVRGLQRATDRIQEAETATAVARATVAAACEGLDLPLAACWLHDDGALEPVAGAATDVVTGSLPADAPERRAFETGESRAWTPADRIEGVEASRGSVIPLDEHGVLAVAHPPAATADGVIVEAARTLAEHASTALSRADRAAAVRERERRLRMIADRVDEVIYLADADFSEVLYVNRAYEAVFDRPVEELYEDATSFVRWIHPDDRADFRAEFGRMLDEIAAGEAADSYEFEFRIERPDGETRWIHATGYPITTPTGKRRYVGVAEDVTERRRREREYRQIFDGVNDALAVYDPADTRLVDVNRPMCELLGYDRETLLELGIDGLSVTEDGYTRDRAAEIVDRVMATGETGETEWALETADGDRVWVEVSASPAEINGQERLLSVARDVTERRRQERLLREFAERIDAVIAIYASPAMDEVEYVSPGYEELFGRPVDEFDDHPTAHVERIHPDDREEYLERLRSMRADVREGGTGPYVREYRIRPDDTAGAGADGTAPVRWVETRGYPVREGGTVVRYISITQDVTDRHVRERRLESFQDATAELTSADSPAGACETAVEAAVDVLDLDAVAVLRYDADEGRLSIAARSPAMSARADGLDAVGPGSGPVWEAFAEGTARRVTPAKAGVAAGGLADLLVLPLTGHGAMVVGAAEGLATDAVESAHLLAATLEAGLNRLRGERRLEAREAELEAQTERARRLDRAVELTRRIESAITDEADRGGVERAVCERLVEFEPFAVAWIGTADVGADRLHPSAVAGASPDRVERVLAADDDDDPHPAHEAWRRDERRTVTDLVGGPRTGWRRVAVARGAGAVCAVPLSHRGVTHGVLTVVAETPGAVDERERRLLDQLGASIGHALTAVERRRALESDDTVELEFRGADPDLGFARLADRLDRRVRHDRTVSRRDGTADVYYLVEGTDADGRTVAAAAAATLPGETEVVARRAGGLVIEREATDWFGAVLSEYGAVPCRAVATPDRTTLVVESPERADVRRLVERVTDAVDGLELHATRRHGADGAAEEPGLATAGTAGLDERLTDRQREAVETALAMGYFAWPRENSGEEVAAELGITQPTLNKHLRVGLRRCLEALLGRD